MLAVVRQSQKFSPRTDPLAGVQDGQNLISWRWSLLYLQTQFGEDRCTQFRVIVLTDPSTHKHTHSQTGPITIHCAAASVQFKPASVNPSRRCLRSAACGDLVVPATKTVCYGPRSFSVAGPATWNSLPASLRDDQLSVPAFRRLLKTELFTRATYDSSLARS